MSVKHKLFVAVSVILAVAASALGTVEYARKSKRASTAEHWLRLLSGADQRNQAQAPTEPVQAGAPAELIGRTGYPLYN